MKKIYSLVLVAMLSVSCVFSTVMPVKAAESADYVDGSYLIDSEASEGVSQETIRGIYYQSGTSTILKSGTGRIAAGGTTIAAKIVNTVSITVRVERLVNGSWQVYTSWSATRYNAPSVATSKTISVPTGYYYRTHSFHSANSESSSSVTNGMWI